MHRFLLLAAVALAALLPLPAAAENSMRSGDITVHYNAVPTTSLTPEVARQVGVTRSANRALVNVSIRQGEPGADRALPGRVELSVSNLNGQRTELRAREVREGEAIYYLAEARVQGNETLTFDLVVTPEGGEPMRTSFRQEFFTR